ncbi:TetR/AcrR family transcriptional regulator [Alterisphingorhabdus coralli]|uniref:TetR/AcrR family transcriptional regulator n=1 Tax=Alterisphingorhabdus coralli TaxID=3071408 RepID=A0AA97F8V8_9SPHN|nr:TetR/AcrR family transcriptional regulator [Parasphingorhabdus sp. SCSIO 66989]WOE75427.1 TetR/AcrR family transcriptional regulator [Parasphingorhabdus sp. SCSIO 66989]
MDQQASSKAEAQDPELRKTGKEPRTSRGRATQKKLLDAAALEFGEKGYHEASVSSITRRAGTALGSFYTYFDSKDEIFRALVQHMSKEVGHHAASAMSAADNALEREQLALEGFLAFTRSHKEIYRIIDEAEFVDPDSYRSHYETVAERIASRLQAGAESGEMRGDMGELEAWALMGMNVFLGLRYGVWNEDETLSDADIAEIGQRANRFLRNGIGPEEPVG